MRRLTLACAALFLTAGAAQAQPTLTTNSTTPNPGVSVNLTVTGVAGQSYAVVGSTTWGGFSYAGVNLAVGTDVTILSVGVLDGSGQAVVPFSPPFPARDRFYVQAVTSANNFASITASNRLTLVNNQVARLFMPVGGLVNSSGTVISISPGVSVSLAGNVFTIDHPGLFEFNSPVPLVTPTGGATVQSISTTFAQTVVTLSGPGGIAFIIEQARR